MAEASLAQAGGRSGSGSGSRSGVGRRRARARGHRRPGRGPAGACGREPAADVGKLERRREPARRAAGAGAGKEPRRLHGSRAARADRAARPCARDGLARCSCDATLPRMLQLARLGVKPQPGPKVRPGPKDKPGPGGTKEQPERDPDRAERSTIVPGDKAWRVRQSKVALVRYLKRHRRETTRGLRRKLLTEVRTPKTARLASPAWERAVRESQAIAKPPVTGQLDEPLEKALLRKLWPSDAALRRIVRATPAWRTMPGQVSRNFALREFACNDGTQYIDGLVREQGLTKKQAKFRAKQLADRLERLRAREGNRALRPNSVFRSKAHNARVGGVPGSAHTKGYAADLRGTVGPQPRDPPRARAGDLRGRRGVLPDAALRARRLRPQLVRQLDGLSSHHRTGASGRPFAS